MIPRQLSPEQRQESDRLRQLFFSLLSSPARDLEFSSQEQLAIVDKLNSLGASWELQKQAERDMKLYRAFDCAAMWLDSDSGLVVFSPEPILAVGKMVEELWQKLKE